jgi:uncharacterized protein YndB with AHSA1/START domain
MLVKTLVVLAVVAAAFVVIVAMQPSEFRVARTATVAAPVSAVFAEVNDFHKWRAWSPYDKLDPAMKRTYAGAPVGKGAVYSWVGNGQAGEGRATIVESRPNELVRIQLEFVKPFAATPVAEFAFRADGDRTTVEWSLAGTNNFVAKAVHLFMNMDRMVGGQFEEGLAQLRSVTEAPPRG